MNSSYNGKLVVEEAPIAQSGLTEGEAGRELNTVTLLALYSPINNFPFAYAIPPSSPPCHLCPSPGKANISPDFNSEVVEGRLFQKYKLSG